MSHEFGLTPEETTFAEKSILQLGCTMRNKTKSLKINFVIRRKSLDHQVDCKINKFFNEQRIPYTKKVQLDSECIKDIS